MVTDHATWHLAILSSPSGLASHLSVEYWPRRLALLQYWFRRLVSCTTPQLIICSSPSDLTSHFSVCFQFSPSGFVAVLISPLPSGSVAVLISPHGLVSYLSVDYQSCRSGILQYRSHRLASPPTSQLIIGLAVWLRCSIGSAVWSHALLISCLLVRPTGILQHPPRSLASPLTSQSVFSSCCPTSCSFVSPYGLAVWPRFVPFSWLLISPSGLLLQYWSRRLAPHPMSQLVIGFATW